ncbi:MAG: cupin domain-containing protein [Gemmatimonadales bacterium]
MSTHAFTLTGITAEHSRRGARYYEFLRVPALSAGVYRLAVGDTDPQHPHAENEVYHVLHGHATLQVDARDVPVGPGSIVYVPAGAPHRFHSITEEIEVLVVFAPAESAGGEGC